MISYSGGGNEPDCRNSGSSSSGSKYGAPYRPPSSSSGSGLRSAIVPSATIIDTSRHWAIGESAYRPQVWLKRTLSLRRANAEPGSEPDPLKLPGRAFRQLRQKHDGARDLEGGQRRGCEFAEFLLRCRHFWHEHHGRSHIFAELCMRHREHNHLRNGGMPQQDFFYFDRRNFFAPTIDHLFEAPGQEHVAVLVDVAFVARPKPSIRERAGVRLW